MIEPLPPQPFRLLVFDWDGTLMDSIGSIVACTQATIVELGLATVPAARIRSSVGLGGRATVELLRPGSDEATARRIMETFRRHWFATYRDRPVLFPSAAPALSTLAAAGIGHLFHASRTADESRAKPHPQMLLDLLDELGARPAETLMVGDSRWDLEMAAGAGTPAVAVTTGAHRHEELEGSAPLAILDDLGELPEWLRRVAPPA